MAKMTDAELEEYLKEDKPAMMTDDEIAAALNEDVAKPEEMSFGKGLAKTAVQALPVAGSLVGAAVAGGPTLGAAALGGSALGAMAGRAAQTLIEENFLNEQPKSLEEKFTELPKEAAYDVVGNVTGEKIIAPIAKLVGKGLLKTSSAMSGVPKEVISHYSDNIKAVDQIQDLPDYADKARKMAQASIERFKGTQNKEISTALNNNYGVMVDVTPAKNVVENSMKIINTKVNPEKFNALKEQWDFLNSLGKEDGNKLMMPLEDAYALKQKLQEMSEFIPQGQNFKKKDFVDQTYASMSRQLRKSVNSAAPDIANAELNLAKLRGYDKSLNRNLIKAETPYNAMISAGSGQNPMNASKVERLGNLIGEDLLTPMKNLAAADKLGNADLISSYTTGRAMIPVTAATLGYGAGGVGGAINAGIAASMGTPIGIKYSLKGANFANKIGLTPQKVGSELIQYLGPNIQNALTPNISRTPQGQQDIATVMQMMSPYDREQYIKKDNSITPTQKAILLKQNRNAR